MDTKVILGYVLGAIALILSLINACLISNTLAARSINLQLCIFGATFGWMIGILITPKKGEAKEFERIGGAILTFVTGYGLAKTDQLFAMAVEKDVVLEQLFLGRFILFATTFFIGALFVFVGRKYWQDDPHLHAEAQSPNAPST